MDDAVGAAKVRFRCYIPLHLHAHPTLNQYMYPIMQFIADNKLEDAGAVASSLAAELYGLNILARDIQVCYNLLLEFVVSNTICSIKCCFSIG